MTVDVTYYDTYIVKGRHYPLKSVLFPLKVTHALFYGPGYYEPEPDNTDVRYPVYLACSL